MTPPNARKSRSARDRRKRFVRPALGHSIEPLESRIAPTTAVSLTGGTLSVIGQDLQTETLAFTVSGPNLLITDTNGQNVNPGPGASFVTLSSVSVPLNSITGDFVIQTGTGGDSLSFNSGMTLLANLNATTSGTVTFNQPLGLASGKTLTVNAGGTISLPGTLSDLSTSGSGGISLTTARDIVMSSGSSATVAGGNLTLQANLGGATPGTFVGISLNDADLITNGAGPILLSGTGGNNADGNAGILLQNDSHIFSTSTTATSASITLTGKGGGTGNSNGGVVIAPGGANISVQSASNLAITGTEGVGTNSDGISIGANAPVQSLAGAGISLIANNINIDPANAVINSGTGITKLAPRLANTAIDVGGPDVANVKLGLTVGELSRITAGSVEIGDAASGTLSVVGGAPITYANNLSLVTGATFLSTTSLTISGTANLTVAATGGIDFSGVPLSVGGTTTLSAGVGTAITVTNPGNSLATVNVTNGASVFLTDNGGFNLGNVNISTLLSLVSDAAITQSAPITGGGGLTKSGTGTLRLTAANTYSGLTSIDGGTLQLGAANVLPDGSGKGDVSVTGALDLNGFNETINGLLGNGSVVNNAGVSATLTVGNNDAGTTFGGTISGPNSLTKIGIGTLTLGNANTYGGSTNINAGMLQLGIANALPIGTALTLGDGTSGSGVLDLNNSSQEVASLTTAGNGTGNRVIDSKADATVPVLTVNLGGATQTFAGILGGASADGFALTKSGTGTLVLTGANSYSGITTISAGTLQVGNGSTGTLGTGTVTDNGALVFNRSGTLTVSNNISGNGTLTSGGGGTLILSGTNTYTGTTTVSAGTLQVDGSLTGSAAVNVSTGGTLGGNNGTIASPTVTTIDGTLAPGGTPGPFNTSSVSFNAGSIFSVEVNGSAAGAHDQLNVTGAVSLGNAVLNVTGTVTTVQSILLIDNDSNDPVIGTFNNLPEAATVNVNGLLFSVTYRGGSQGNDVMLVAPIPETQVSLNANGDLEIADVLAGGHNDSLTIQQTPGSNGLFTISDPNHNLASAIPGLAPSADLHTLNVPVSLVTGQILVNGLGGDDTLAVNLTPGPLTKALTFDGGDGPVADRLVLASGGLPSGATFNFDSVGFGSASLLGSQLISYAGVENVDSQVPALTTALNYNSAGLNTITASDGGAGKTTVTSSAGSTLNLLNPTVILTINGGSGDDTITANSLSNFPGVLVMFGQGGTDSVTIRPGLPTLGGLVATAEGISNLPMLTLGAGGLDITAQVSGFNLTGNITSSGPVKLSSGGAIGTTGGSIQAPSVTASAVDGLTLSLSGGSISATVTGGGGIALSGTDPTTPTSIVSLVPGTGGVDLVTGRFQLGKSDAITREANLAVGGTFDLNGLDQTVGGLSSDGTVQNSATALSTFTVGAGDANATFQGALDLHLALVKIGTGKQIIDGAHQGADGTTITGGTLQFDQFGSALNAPFTLAGGTLFYNFTPSAALTPKITVLNSSTIGVSLSNLVTLAGAITGPVAGDLGALGSLTKSGEGLLIFANDLNDFGPTKVKITGGKLQVATDGALGDVANDVEINDATFASSAAFASGRNFSKATSAATATIDAQVGDLILINKAVETAVLGGDLTLQSPANVSFAFVFADPLPPATLIGGRMTFNGTTVSISGGGTAIVHKDALGGVDSIELSGTTSKSKLVIKGPADGSTITINHIFIDDDDPNKIASIGSITLGTNVILGDGLLHDSVPELYVEGTTGKLTLYDINSYALIDLGEGLPHGDSADKKTPSSKTNHPNLTIHEVLGPGMIIDLTPSDLPPDLEGELVGGGGLGKVVVNTWDYSGPLAPATPGIPGSIRTTQNITSFKLLNGDCSVVFMVDKYGVGSDTYGTCGSMTIQNGNWGSTGSEIEGGIGVFNANAFIAGATLTCGKMGKFGLDAGAFAGLLTITDPDSSGIPTFTVNGDFVGTVDSMGAPIQKIKVNGNFMGDLTASFISSITAYGFLDAVDTQAIHAITATDGKLGTLKATQGVVRNLTIVTDDVFKGFNVKPSKKVTEDTVGIDNVSITAASIGPITVTLAADATQPGIDLVGIRNSQFITTGNGTVSPDIGNIGNVTVTLTGAANGTSSIGIQNSTFDALVNTGEFNDDPAASTVNTLGKITVKLTAMGGTSLGLDGATFSGNSIGATAITVTPAAGATATAIDSASYTATGAIGALAISGNATSAMVAGLKVSAGTTVGAVTVKSKTLANGTLKDSAILAGQALDMTGLADPAKLALAKLTSVNVTGSLVNTDLVAGGSIGAVTVGKNLTDSMVLAGAKLGDDGLLGGTGGDLDTFQRSAAIAAITVKGNLSSSSIAAGIKTSNTFLGDGDTAATNLAGASSIGAIIVTGSLTTGSPSLGAHQFAIEAGTIKSLKLGAITHTNFTSPLYIDTDASNSDSAADILVKLV